MAADGKRSQQTSTPVRAGKMGKLSSGDRAGDAGSMRLTGHVPETEEGFRQAIQELASALQWIQYHTWRSDKSPPGFPDLVLCRPPYVIFAEVKTAKGRMTAAQTIWFNRLMRCPGIEVYCWRPEHWESIVARLQGRVP